MLFALLSWMGEEEVEPVLSVWVALLEEEVSWVVGPGVHASLAAVEDELSEEGAYSPEVQGEEEVVP